MDVFTFHLLSGLDDLLRGLLGGLDLRQLGEADVRVALHNVGLQQG